MANRAVFEIGDESDDAELVRRRWRHFYYVKVFFAIALHVQYHDKFTK